MSEKISAMTPATACSDAAVFPIVDGGANFKCTRNVFLTATAGEDINISAAGGACNILLDSGGGLDLVFDRAVGFEVSDGSQDYFNVDTAGNVFITALAGQDITIATDNATMTMTAAGTFTFTIVPGQHFIIPYSPFAPINWSGSAPTDLISAVDRIADFIGQGGLTPIP